MCRYNALRLFSSRRCYSTWWHFQPLPSQKSLRLDRFLLPRIVAEQPRRGQFTSSYFTDSSWSGVAWSWVVFTINWCLAFIPLGHGVIPPAQFLESYSSHSCKSSFVELIVKAEQKENKISPSIHGRTCHHYCSDFQHNKRLSTAVTGRFHK